MLKFEIILTQEAQDNLDFLAKNKGQERTYKAVVKALWLMNTNLRHPSLSTHEFLSKSGPHGEKLLESYAQNNTPGAYRIF